MAPQAHVSDTLSGERFKQLLRRSILIPMVGSILLALIFLWQLTALLRANDLADHSDKVLEQAQLTERLVVDSETAIRGYLIGRDKVFLDPYRKSTKRLH